MTHKIGIFVDVQNIYYTTKDVFGKSFDYRKFWKNIEAKGEITVAKAYAVDRRIDSQMKFQSALRHMGFDVVLKNYIQRKDGTAKGDWDVGITIDVVESAPELDEVILLSGDGDFAILLKHVMQKYDVKTTVYGVKTLTSEMLSSAANTYQPVTMDMLIS